MPFLHSINFARCPVVVQSLSSCCPINERTTIGQQTDNDRRRSCNLLVMNARFFLVKNGGVDRHQVYVWVHSATHPTLRFCSPLRYRNGWCDTPRPTATPLREGMGCRITLIINKSLPRHPLSERGGEGRGVSHCQTPLIWGVSHHQTSSIQSVSHCQISYPLNPVNPWFTYRGPLRSKFKKNLFQNYTNPPQRGQSPAEMPLPHRIIFVRCPVVVRSLSSCCPVNNWTTTGQRADNDWTTNEDGLVTCW